jgi:hypothetical protein
MRKVLLAVLLLVGVASSQLVSVTSDTTVHIRDASMPRLAAFLDSLLLDFDTSGIVGTDDHYSSGTTYNMSVTIWYEGVTRKRADDIITTLLHVDPGCASLDYSLHRQERNQPLADSTRCHF